MESIFNFMNPNIFQPLPVLSTGEIHEILVRRVDQQKQAAGIVVGVIEPAGRRVVAYGNLANGDPRTLDGDTIFVPLFWRLWALVCLLYLCWLHFARSRSQPGAIQARRFA